MKNFSFNRTIPISPLYREVSEWRKENVPAGAGFTRLTAELCDLFSQHDPDWIGEGGWTDALDQYVYVEYIMQDAEGRTQGVTPFLKEEMPEGNAKVSLRSCEDDLCLEILASDMMVRYCVAEQRSEELWTLVVRETAIMSVLYELNGKGDAFWKELLHLNRTLGVIDEQPVVRRSDTLRTSRCPRQRPMTSCCWMRARAWRNSSSGREPSAMNTRSGNWVKYASCCCRHDKKRQKSGRSRFFYSFLC